LLVENGIDTISMNKDPQLLRKDITGPHIVDSHSYFVGIHLVDLNHVRVIVTHIDIAGIFYDHFRAIITIG